MADMVCPVCEQAGVDQYTRLDCSGAAVEVKGIIRCLRDQHEWPFVMSKGYLRELGTSLPGAYSQHFLSSVPDHLQADIEEAERANYAQCYNAAVVMCRRALQLGLTQKGIPGWKLSIMLKEAIKQGMLPNTDKQAEAVKSFGDSGAHRMDDLRPEHVHMAIFAAVEILNELFPQP